MNFENTILSKIRQPQKMVCYDSMYRKCPGQGYEQMDRKRTGNCQGLGGRDTRG
jgi:hypothetical protein